MHFLQIVTDNFAGHEDLRQEILHRVPKYGNDVENVDLLARRLCTIALDALVAAQLHPAQYRTLCVRVTGFSEYSVALSPEAQAAFIARTEY